MKSGTLFGLVLFVIISYAIGEQEEVHEHKREPIILIPGMEIHFYYCINALNMQIYKQDLLVVD